MNSAAPKKIKLHRQSQQLELQFGDQIYQLSAEYLRVFSPSAEVKGHGPGQETLQLNKHDVNITHIEMQGNYAIKLIFSDHHNSGIYSWPYLRELAENYAANWREYLSKVEEHQLTQEVSPVKWIPS